MSLLNLGLPNPLLLSIGDGCDHNQQNDRDGNSPDYPHPRTQLHEFLPTLLKANSPSTPPKGQTNGMEKAK